MHCKNVNEQESIRCVSVVIPVYNAAGFVAQAVESALVQPETLEVLLIEDGSPDASLSVCKVLAEKHERVRLLRHQGGVNRGGGPSRNLGIENAQGAFIAFLDADDYYLPNRFTMAISVLEKYPDVHGVYEATGATFDNAEAETTWYKYNSRPLTTMCEVSSPEWLFEELVAWKNGFIHCNALTVRRDVFQIAGLFDHELQLADDMFMWIKMAAKVRLVPGNLLEPVAMRRMHDHNRTTCKPGVSAFCACMLWRKLLAWGFQEKVPRSRQNLLLERYLAMTEYHYMSCRFWRLRKLLGLMRLPYVIARWPRALRLKAFWDYTKENAGIILGRTKGKV